MQGRVVLFLFYPPGLTVTFNFLLCGAEQPNAIGVALSVNSFGNCEKGKMSVLTSLSSAVSFFFFPLFFVGKKCLSILHLMNPLGKVMITWKYCADEFKYNWIESQTLPS